MTHKRLQENPEKSDMSRVTNLIGFLVRTRNAKQSQELGILDPSDEGLWGRYGKVHLVKSARYQTYKRCAAQSSTDTVTKPIQEYQCVQLSSQTHLPTNCPQAFPGEGTSIELDKVLGFLLLFLSNSAFPLTGRMV